MEHRQKEDRSCGRFGRSVLEPLACLSRRLGKAKKQGPGGPRIFPIVLRRSNGSPDNPGSETNERVDTQQQIRWSCLRVKEFRGIPCQEGDDHALDQGVFALCQRDSRRSTGIFDLLGPSRSGKGTKRSDSHLQFRNQITRALQSEGRRVRTGLSGSAQNQVRQPDRISHFTTKGQII